MVVNLSYDYFGSAHNHRSELEVEAKGDGDSPMLFVKPSILQRYESQDKIQTSPKSSPKLTATVALKTSSSPKSRSPIQRGRDTTIRTENSPFLSSTISWMQNVKWSLVKFWIHVMSTVHCAVPSAIGLGLIVFIFSGIALWITFN